MRRIDAAIFDFCKYGGPALLAAVLRALGNAERELAVGEMPADKRRCWPLGGLSPQWFAACDDGSAEYRLACSIASLSSGIHVRCNLEPVERLKNKPWAWAEQNRAAVWTAGPLARNLGAVLPRRLRDADDESAPLAGTLPVSLGDVSLFLSNNRTDDGRTEELIWGFSLVDVPSRSDPVRPIEEEPLPRAYALLKLTLLPGMLAWERSGDGVALRHSMTDGLRVHPEAAILARLRGGDVGGACDIAARRLRASGFVPLAKPRELAGDPERLLAALLFPISDRDIAILGQLVLGIPSPDTIP